VVITENYLGVEGLIILALEGLTIAMFPFLRSITTEYFAHQFLYFFQKKIDGENYARVLLNKC